MYLTAFLTEELGRIAQDERLADADRARLARLAACSRASTRAFILRTPLLRDDR